MAKGCEFSVADIRNHRNGIHMPEVRWQPNEEKIVVIEVEGKPVKVRLESPVLGELVMFGRSIPVISPEQLMGRLIQIGVQKEVREEIVGQLFGFAISTEASVAVGELVECEV